MGMSTEEAIEKAKLECLDRQLIGFVVVLTRGKIFYKRREDVREPSLKYASTGRRIASYVLLAPSEEARCHDLVAESKKNS